MKRKHKIVLGVALLVLCISIGLGIALWYLFGGNPNDSGDNGDDTTTVTPGDLDENPETPHEHTYTSAVTREPTCTQEGEMTYTCTCGDSYTEPIAMTAHTEVIDEAVAPSCTKTGLTEGKHCSVCGTVLVEQEVVPMTAHTEVIDAAVAPTCTQTGLTEGKHCSVCGAVLVEQEVVPMTAHTEVIDAAVKPTCTQTGLTEGKHCSVCDTVLVEQEVVPMTAHNYVGEVTKKPTCKQEGEMTYTCSGCGGSYTESIPMTAHTEVIDKAVAPTCTATGSTEGKHCSVCGEILVEQQVIAMIPHDYSDEWDSDDEDHWHVCTECGARADIAAHIPDRDQPGENDPVKCTVCEYIIEPATGHIVHTAGDQWFSDGVNHWQTCIGCGIKMNEAAHSGGVATCISKAQCAVCNAQYGDLAAHSPEVIPAVAPTCTKTGLTEGQKCSVCGTVLVEQEVVPTIAHNYVGEETKKPTCEQEGEMTYTCSVCGDSYTESIPMTAHTEVIDEAVEPTCTATGLTEGKHCSVCGEILVAQQVIPANGHSYASSVTKKPTCEQEGEMTYTCSACGDSYTESIPMTAHTEVIDEAITPTCIKTGLTEGKHCSVCGEVLVEQEVVPTIAHNYVGEETKKPTCEQEGEMTYTCSGCGGSYTESIPMTAHTEVIDKAVAPSCTKTGLTEGKHCSVCDTVLVEQEVVPMTAHTEVIDAAVAPTCTKTGLTEGKHCSVCGTVLVKQEVIPMTEHTEVIDEAVASSCTQTGLTEGKHCSVCDTVLVEQEVVPMIPHTEVIDAAVKPTCTQTGLTEGKHCSVCNTVLVKQEVIPMTEHSYTSKVTKQPTCTEEGVRTYTCSGCGNSYTEKITANGHTIVIDKAVAPTCTKTGLTEGKHCSVCGTVLVKQEVIPMTEHSYTSKVTKQPTCTEEGVRTYTCSGCGNSYTGSIPMTAHNYVNGVCTMCGKRDESYATNGLVFTLSADGTYYVSDYTGTAKDVYIPVTYKGLPVTNIGYMAFYNCSSLTSITIPDSVTSIGEWTFYLCSSLTSVTFGDDSNLTSIMRGVFCYCSSLTSIKIPDGVTSIGEHAFSYCSSLTSITIPNSVTSIGRSAFSGCSGLMSITVASSNPVYHSAGNCLIETESKTLILGCKNSIIPTDGSVTSIGEWAFHGCSGLTSITIPDSVTSIGEGVFYGCNSLIRITVASGNPVYHSAGNCIIETNSKTLVAGCKNSVIPTDGSVTSIGEWAFYNCSSLTSITIPDSVTSIGGAAFWNCSNLTSITIPDSVTSIGSSAFYNCSSLTSITIPDSVTSIGSGAFRGTAYYNDESNWENGVLYISNHLIEARSTLSGEYIIKQGTKTIADYAFRGCRSLTSITIPDSVTSIGEQEFAYCSSLTSIIIGNGVTSIGYRAFYDCSKLTSVTFVNPNGWWRASSSSATSGTSISSSDLSNASTAAACLTSFYCNQYWKRS